MKSRLTRPLLAVVVGGAVFAGSAVAAGPAFAAPVPDPVKRAADQPLPPTSLPKAVLADETPANGGSTGSTDNSGGTAQNPAASASGSPDPAASASSNPDPGASASANPNPGSSASANPNPGGSSSANPSTQPSNPPAADTTKPSGGFALTSSAPWIGQFITLTQVNVKDNGVLDPAAVKRVVTWGDGSAPSTILPKQTPRKSFTKVGTFTVTLTLTDAAGNTHAAKWPVKVSSPVKAAIDKSSVWHGQRFNVRFSNVPKGTTRITLRYGDGTGIHLAGKNQVVGGIYHRKPNGQIMPPGPVTLTAVYTNRLGATSQVPIGRITIKNDVWRPRTTITRPKNPNRVSSWKTIRGTATDQGSGVQAVAVFPARLTSSGAVQCYTRGQSWLTIRNEAHFAQCGVLVRAVNGKWSLAIRGMKKGEFAVIATAVDWADQAGNDAEAETNLTRN